MAGRSIADMVADSLERDRIRNFTRASIAQQESELLRAEYDARQARDREWVARELGDVPSRWIHGHQTMDDFTTVQQGVDLGYAHLGDTAEHPIRVEGDYLP